MVQPTTREGWLNSFIEAARPVFAKAGHPIPAKVRASIGFSSKGVRSRRIGECWSHLNSVDGYNELFIVPSLLDDASRVADVLTHELIHTAVGLEAGHGPAFRYAAKLLGLTGKMTATTAGPEWHAWADPILAQLGTIPGAQLNAGNRQSSAPKTQGTRMKKLSCDECGFNCRATQSNIDLAPEGLTCPTGCGGHLVQEVK